MLTNEIRFARSYRFILTCQKCGCEFKSFKEDRKYCDKHRWTDRQRPKNKRVCSCCGKTFEGVGKEKYCSKECQREILRKKEERWRRNRGVMPREIKPKPEPTPKPVKIKSPIAPKARPKIADKIEIELPIPPAPPIYKRVQTGAKTWIEFSSKERYEKWLAKNAS